MGVFLPQATTKTIIMKKNELLTGSELVEAVDDAERMTAAWLLQADEDGVECCLADSREGKPKRTKRV